MFSTQSVNGLFILLFPTTSGVNAPSGRTAVGWRIGVYWKDDMTFYEGRILSFDSVTGALALGRLTRNLHETVDVVRTLL